MVFVVARKFPSFVREHSLHVEVVALSFWTVSFQGSKVATNTTKKKSPKSDQTLSYCIGLIWLITCTNSPSGKRALEVAACACREEEIGTAEWIFVKK